MNNKQTQEINTDFLKLFMSEIITYLKQTTSGQKPVTNFKLPQHLQQIIDFNVRREPCSDSDLADQLKLIMDYQVKSNHPHFHNQLFGGFDQYATLANILSTVMNGTMYTYEIAPVFTLMEKYIYEQLRGFLGWQQIDGMMTPGGSFGNWMGMLMARYQKYPQTKTKGIKGIQQMKLLTSDQSHYSIDKGSILQGFGTDNVIKVKSNQKGEMIPEELQKQIQKILNNHQIPLLVNSTLGTTVGGAIDPIETIGHICKKYGIWHHVDAALGGGFILESQLRNKLGDLTNVDSLIWDAHKSLPIPLQATFFLCQHPGLMESSNSVKADYLFHSQRKSYDKILDTGDNSLQCGRITDILKVWTYFKARGWNQVARQVQKQHELALLLQRKLKQKQKQWITVYPTTTFNVCGFYIPEAMREQPQDSQFFKKLSKVVVEAKRIMIQQGKVMISYSTNGFNSNYFWRIVMLNPNITERDLNYQIQLLEKYCQQAYNLLFQKGEPEQFAFCHKLHAS